MPTMLTKPINSNIIRGKIQGIILIAAAGYQPPSPLSVKGREGGEVCHVKAFLCNKKPTKS